MDTQDTRKALLAKKLKVLPLNGRKPEPHPFVPLNLGRLICGGRCPCPLYIKVRGAGEEEIRFAPYLKEGEYLEENWLAPLHSLGIERLYFHKDHLDKILAYLNNCLLILAGDDLRQIKARLETLSEHLQLSLRQAFQAPRLGPHARLARRQIDLIITELKKDDQALGLIWEILTTSYNLYSHSVNVCLLATAEMLFLKKTVQESRLVGLAALFHDVGMTRMPPEIFFKTSPLTPEEWYMVKHHPELGKRMLGDCAVMPLEGLRLILEHHENADGSGYPQGLTLAQQHRLTRLVRVADAYDALTNNSLYRPVKTPFAALREMKSQQGVRGPVFDPQTLDNFIIFLGQS